MKVGHLFKTIDWVLAIVPIILLSFGIAVIFSLASGGGTTISINQTIYAVIGAIIAVTLTFVDYRTWKSLAWVIYGLGIIALAIVLVVGSRAFGATRWIDFGFFQFQPSELMKLCLIITLARYFSDKNTIGFKEFLAAAILVIIPLVLVLVQPDLGSASVLLFTSFVLFLVARVPKSIIAALVLAIVLIAPVGYHFIASYQRDRIKTFINPNADPTGSGYNVLQSKIAIGSGGIWGRGLGQGSQSQLNFLPVAHTDFIFAGVAEATGFLGSAALLLLVGIVIYRGVVIARLSQDSFGMYLAIGIASLYLYQTFINAGGNLGLVPITGIPFPFVSFGGTATIIALSGIGLLESIYLRHKKIRFS